MSLPAPFLPMSRAEMEHLGWDACDVVLVTGDAYIDHPSFGAALIGRGWESLGYRVGIIAQPDWTSAADFARLGPPRLAFAVTAGNMDSMVNRYTSERKLRHDDAYTPNGEGGKRPDRAVVVYAQRCREAFKGVPIILGGIEASLRRLAHYDYWSDTVRRSVLVDAKADFLVYGNGESAAAEILARLKTGAYPHDLNDIRGTAVLCKTIPDGWSEVDCSQTDPPPPRENDKQVLRLPSFETLKNDAKAVAQATRVLYLETNPAHARPLVQRHGDREVWVNPPALPLTTAELDRVYELPFIRRPHPTYGKAHIPAWEMIKTSVTILRGCFGGCAFCSITAHEGRVVQSRSPQSIVGELEKIRDQSPKFSGTISDLGGATANMWRMGCKDPAIEAKCRRLSCVYPTICKNLRTDHGPLRELYRIARQIPGIKRIFVASGLRYDLAMRDPDYIRDLMTHHIGGTFKVAPEHSEAGPLACMMKPGIDQYEQFQDLFRSFNKDRNLRLIPYFIAAHPGTRDEDMLALALWLKHNNMRVDQVQTFLPSPLSLSTAMYHSGLNPLHPLNSPETTPLPVAKGEKQRRLHKAFLRWHDPANHPLLRRALRTMGRADLIGNGKQCLVPFGRD